MAPRPRLLVLASTFPASPGDGVPAFVLDIAAEEAREFDVLVLTPMVPGAARHERIGDVEVRRFRYFPARFEDLADGAILDNLRARRSRWLQVGPLVAAQAAAVRRVVRRFRPDVIHAHWLIPQGFAARMAAPRVPLVVTTHGGDIYALNQAPIRRLKDRILRAAAAVTTVNSDMRGQLVSRGLPEDRVSVLPMGVPLAEAAQAAVGQTRVPGSILVVGRLVEKKGFGVLLEALRILPPEREWSLVIVGDGPLRAELETAAAGLPVTFLGQQARSEVLRHMAHCSVLALPSVTAASGDQEGLPVVLLEGAAMGCAIVASDLPGINAVIDGTTGLLVPQGDVRALAGAVDRLLTDEALRARVGAAAAVRAADYSLDRIGAGYRDVVRSSLPISPAR